MLRPTSTESSSNSTQRVERAAKLRAEIRRERDAIAALRAEWAKLDNPARVQGLAARHLRLRPLEATQFDSLDRLPERPPAAIPEPVDPIATFLEQPDEDLPTSSVPAVGSR